MPSQKVIIAFEVDDVNAAAKVHEMLCQAIHESQEEAFSWLEENISDITELTSRT